MSSARIRRRSIVFLLILAICVLLVPRTRGQNEGTTSESGDRSGAPSGDALNFQTDLFTGRFKYGLPIEIPAGRNGLAPRVTIGYDSSTGNGLAGVGWNFDLGYIQRETSRGVPVAFQSGQPQTAYDDAKGWSFSFQGSSSKLVAIFGSQYRAEIDQSRFEFEYFDNFGASFPEPFWLMIDKSGTKYWFGETENSRMYNPNFPSGAGSSVYRYAISRIRDVLGNEIRYTYFKDQNQLYPQKIEYNIQVSSSPIPAQHVVEFDYLSRTDEVITFRPGYRVTMGKLLQFVHVKRADQTLIRRYQFSYLPSQSTRKSLLVQFRESGNDGSSYLPPLVFGYTGLSKSFEPATNWSTLDSGQSTSDPSWGSPIYRKSSSGKLWNNVDLLDIDSDGLPDRVMRKSPTPQDRYLVQFNNGKFGSASGFHAKSDWMNVDDQDSINDWWSSPMFTTDTSDTTMGLWDLDGDHRIDHVARPATGGAITTWRVQKNNGVSFDNQQAWSSIDSQGAGNTNYDNPFGGETTETYSALMDINGDGLLDRVMDDRATTTNTRLVVQLNTGTGFSTQLTSWPGVQDQGVDDGATVFTTKSKNTTAGLWDLNGDGLPDRIIRKPAAPYDSFMVQFNNGAGFEAAETWGPVQSEVGSADVNWNSPVHVVTSSSEILRRAALIDINGDGLVDRVITKSTAPYDRFKVQINNGSDFGPMVDWTGLDSSFPSANNWNAITASKDQTDSGTYAMMMDMNGDRLPDRVLRAVAAPFDYFRVQLQAGPIPDLLRTIDNSIGANVTATYRSSVEYDNRDIAWSGDPWSAGAKSLLPFPVITVASVNVDSGYGWSSTTNYSYKHGYYDSTRKEFRGFNCVEALNPTGTKTRTYFHQGGGFDDSANGEYQDVGAIAKVGMPYKIEVIGANGAVYRTTLHKVLEEELHSAGWYFPYIAQTIVMDHDGLPTSNSVASQFAYDFTTLNPTMTADLGKVTVTFPANHQVADIGNDTLYTITSYANVSANPSIVDRPSSVKKATDSLGTQRLAETRFVYSPNSKAQIIRSEKWLKEENRWIVETYTYDANGNREYATDAEGGVTRVLYDSPTFIYPRYSQFIAGSTTFTTETIHDQDTGAVVQRTDSKGMVTRHFYDAHKRPSYSERATEPFAVGAGNQWIWTERWYYYMSPPVFGQSWVQKNVNDGVDPLNGQWTVTWIDGLGRPIAKGTQAESTAPGAARWVEYVYDVGGRVERQTLTHFTPPSFPVSTSLPATVTTYDALGRVLTVTPPAGDAGSPTGTVSSVYHDYYDPWSTVVTDPAGHTKTYVRDAHGRTHIIREITSQGTFNTNFQYNLLGNLELTTDAAGNITQTQWDSLGRRISINDPDLGFWSYEYDDLGRLTAQIDAKQQRTEFTLDTLGRVLEKRSKNASGIVTETVTYVYDVSTDPAYIVFPGQTYMITDGQGWEKRSYDVWGRVTKATRFVTKNNKTYTISYEYDDADRPTRIYYPRNGVIVDYTFDTGGVVVKVESAGGTGPIETFYEASQFNELGQVLAIDYGSGTHTSFEYYQNSKRLKRTLTVNAAATVLQDLTYTFDEVTNVKSIADALHSGASTASLSNIGYDDLDRLSSYTHNGTTYNFSYDAIGNILSNGELAGSNYVYTSGRPHAVASTGLKTYAYDANGAMIARGTQTLTYDAQNRLVQVFDNATSATSSYGYTYSSDRLWRETPQGLAVFVAGIFEERGGKNLNHVYAGGRHVVTFESSSRILPVPATPQPIGGQPVPIVNPVFFYHHQDHLSGANVLTDRVGTLAQRYEYKAFGGARYTANATAFAMSNRFTDHVADDDTGLYYMRSRYYDPEIGRFLTADTEVAQGENPQGLNRYSYALNNPMKYTDPTGHFAFFAFLIKALVAGIIGGVTAEIQGGDFWKGFLSGVVLFVGGELGFIGQIAGGAASAEIQGGDWRFGAASAAFYSGGQAAAVKKMIADFEKDVNSLVSNGGHFIQTQAAQRIVGSISAHYGWNPAAVNGTLFVGSHVGNLLTGTRVHPDSMKVGDKEVPGPILFGILSRDTSGLLGDNNTAVGFVFDVVDIALAYQGLPTASAQELLSMIPEGGQAGLVAHSLGTIDMANLSAMGMAPSARLLALPLGVIGPFGAATAIGRCDIVPFFGVNGVLNATTTTFYNTGSGPVASHGFESYVQAVF